MTAVHLLMLHIKLVTCSQWFLLLTSVVLCIFFDIHTSWDFEDRSPHLGYDSGGVYPIALVFLKRQCLTDRDCRLIVVTITYLYQWSFLTISFIVTTWDRHIENCFLSKIIGKLESLGASLVLGINVWWVIKFPLINNTSIKSIPKEVKEFKNSIG